MLLLILEDEDGVPGGGPAVVSVVKKSLSFASKTEFEFGIMESDVFLIWSGCSEES
jgi:hypothetical protein